MKIYTRSGDKGTTALVGGSRIAKNDLRVETYGTCDEANAMIGLAVSFLEKEDWAEKDEFLKRMYRVQTLLFHVGAELSTPADKEVAWKLKQAHIDELEAHIDEWQEVLPALQNFILPSGHGGSSALHVARTVARRAERLAVSLDQEVEGINPLVMAYLNRLSDYLFVAARYLNYQLGRAEMKLQVNV